MNYINVMGATKKKRDLVENAVIFCISELMPRLRTLEDEVNIKNLKDEGVVGGVMKVRIIVTSTLTLIKILISKS